METKEITKTEYICSKCGAVFDSMTKCKRHEGHEIEFVVELFWWYCDDEFLFDVSRVWHAHQKYPDGSTNVVQFITGMVPAALAPIRGVHGWTWRVCTVKRNIPAARQFLQQVAALWARERADKLDTFLANMGIKED